MAGVEPQASPQSAATSAGSDTAADRVRRINRLFRCAFGREPTIDELTDALEFIDRGEHSARRNLTATRVAGVGPGAVDEQRVYVCGLVAYPRTYVPSMGPDPCIAIMFMGGVHAMV